MDKATNVSLIWKNLCAAPKHQQLQVLQQAVGKACDEIKIRAPIIVTPTSLKMTLGIGFCLDSQDDLTSGVLISILGRHTPEERKSLKEAGANYDMVIGGVGAPSMAEADTLTAPNGLTLSNSLSMLQGQNNRLRALAATFSGIG